MTAQTLTKQLITLNEFYTNFKFDLDNRIKFAIWHKSLETIPDKLFEQIIQDYCMNNIYPPQSPTHILDHYKNYLIAQEETPDKSFELMLEDYRKNYDGWYLNTLIKDYKASLNKSKIAVAESLEETYSEFIESWKDSSQLVFYKKRFIELYERNLLKGIKLLVVGESPLQIENKGE